MNFFNTLLSAAQSADKALEIEFVPSRFLDMLPYMGKGMLGIFIVILVIVGITVALNKFTNKNK